MSQLSFAADPQYARSIFENFSGPQGMIGAGGLRVPSVLPTGQRAGSMGGIPGTFDWRATDLNQTNKWAAGTLLSGVWRGGYQKDYDMMFYLWTHTRVNREDTVYGDAQHLLASLPVLNYTLEKSSITQWEYEKEKLGNPDELGDLVGDYHFNDNVHVATVQDFLRTWEPYGPVTGVSQVDNQNPDFHQFTCNVHGTSRQFNMFAPELRTGDKCYWLVTEVWSKQRGFLDPYGKVLDKKPTQHKILQVIGWSDKAGIPRGFSLAASDETVDSAPRYYDVDFKKTVNTAQNLWIPEKDENGNWTYRMDEEASDLIVEVYQLGKAYSAGTVSSEQYVMRTDENSIMEGHRNTNIMLNLPQCTLQHLSTDLGG